MAPIALIVLALALAGCGDRAQPAATTPDPAAVERPASADEAVVRGWAEDLRRGDVEAASARFALPAVVANGTPEITLKTRAEVAYFNRTLPCGGRVTEVVRHAGYLIATFELVDRVGSKCDGAGGTAQTAFEVEDGRITKWLRVPDGGAPAPEGEAV